MGNLCRLLLVLKIAFLSACGNNDQRPAGDSSQQVNLWQGKGFAGRCTESQQEENRGSTFFSVEGAMAKPFDAVALITMSTGRICSGVLVEPRLVLTAAHCFEGQAHINDIEFTTSATKVTPEVSRVQVDPTYAKYLAEGRTLSRHPELASFDSAKVTLKDPVDGIEPVPLTNQSHLTTGKLVAVVGYGDFGHGAGVKRFGQSHIGRWIDDIDIGGTSFHDLILLDSKTGTGVCPGDSGGGVFINVDGQYELLGIVQGINDVLYPGFPVDKCHGCPDGLGIVKLIFKN